MYISQNKILISLCSLHEKMGIQYINTDFLLRQKRSPSSNFYQTVFYRILKIRYTCSSIAL